jgi:hypothetical protein
MATFQGCTFNKQAFCPSEVLEFELRMAVKMACFIVNLAKILDHFTFNKD